MHAASLLLCDAAQEMVRDALSQPYAFIPAIIVGMAVAFWAIYGGRPTPPEKQSPPTDSHGRN
jgi:hypothetical protein